MDSPAPIKSVNIDDLLYEDDNTYSLDGAPFTGIACDFYPDGTTRSEIRLVNGHQEGLAREWYENGCKKSEAEYLGDGHHGIATEWHPNGQLKRKALCEYGICLESEEWDEDGRFKSEFRLLPTDWRFELLEKKRSIWGKKS